ncbi:MAG: TA system VapC family ribonuclease toxin, partial [Nocardioidaceae bacterium]
YRRRLACTGRRVTAPRQSGRALLDVNVLIALAWPNHEGHAAAREWFEHESKRGWATSPVTETGFVRVSSNRRALTTATTPQRAVEMLEQLTTLPGHMFWPDSISLVTGGHIDLPRLSGHRQVTDAHLVALCRAHDAQLVTFDQAVWELAPPGEDVTHVLYAGRAAARTDPS